MIDIVANKVFVNEFDVKPCNVRESVKLKKPEVSFLCTDAVAITWDLKSAVQSKRVEKFELQCKRAKPEGREEADAAALANSSKNKKKKKKVRFFGVPGG